MSYLNLWISHFHSFLTKTHGINNCRKYLNKHHEHHWKFLRIYSGMLLVCHCRNLSWQMKAWTVPTTFSRGRQCHICLNKLQDRCLSLQCPRCEHSFDRMCILQWMEHNNTCPCCRAHNYLDEQVTFSVSVKICGVLVLSLLGLLLSISNVGCIFVACFFWSLGQ